MEIPVGFAQATFIFTGAAAPNGAATTLGLDPVSSDPVDIAELLASAWAANIDAVFSANLQLSSILVKMGPNETGNFHELAVGNVGAVSGSCDPPNTAWLIHKITATGGRRGRGRMFIPGVFAANTNDAGVIDSGTFTALTSSWDAFYEDLVSNNVPPALLHSDSTPPYAITGLTVDPVVATQRRRLRD